MTEQIHWDLGEGEHRLHLEEVIAEEYVDRLLASHGISTEYMQLLHFKNPFARVAFKVRLAVDTINHEKYPEEHLKYSIVFDRHYDVLGYEVIRAVESNPPDAPSDALIVTGKTVAILEKLQIKFTKNAI